MNKKGIVIAGVILVVVVAVFAAVYLQGHPDNTDNKSSKTATVITDDAGREVTIYLPVERMILDTDYINTFAAVGGPNFMDVMVGKSGFLESSDKPLYDAYCDKYPELRGLSNIGIVPDTFSTEKIIDLKADLVVLPSYIITFDYDIDLSPLTAAGIPYIFTQFYDNTFDDGVYERNIRIMGKIFGQEERAEEIVSYFTKETDKVYDKLRSVRESDMTSVYIESISGASEYGFTMVTGMPEIRYAKGNNIVEGHADKLSKGAVDREFLLSSDPKVVIFLVSTYYPGSGGELFGLGNSPSEKELSDMASKYMERPGWSSMSAVKNEDVYFLWGNLLNSVACFSSLQQTAKWLYPELFGDLDPLSTLYDFYDRYIPVDMKGTYTYEV